MSDTTSFYVVDKSITPDPQSSGNVVEKGNILTFYVEYDKNIGEVTGEFYYNNTGEPPWLLVSRDITFGSNSQTYELDTSSMSVGSIYFFKLSMTDSDEPRQQTLNETFDNISVEIISCSCVSHTCSCVDYDCSCQSECTCEGVCGCVSVSCSSNCSCVSVCQVQSSTGCSSQYGECDCQDHILGCNNHCLCDKERDFS